MVLLLLIQVQVVLHYLEYPVVLVDQEDQQVQVVLVLLKRVQVVLL